MADLHRERARHAYGLTSPRNVATFIATLGIVVGVGSGSPGVLCLGLGTALLMVWQRMTLRGVAERLNVTRTCVTRGFEDGSISVTLTIENPTERPLPLVTAVDNFPPCNMHAVRMGAVMLPKRSQLAFTVSPRITSRRGAYTLGPSEIALQDAMGLYEVPAYPGGIVPFVVYPVVPHVRDYPVLGDGTLFNEGEERQNRRGTSLEFRALRPYVAGDSPRLIHWASYARGAGLHIREFERTLMTEVHVFCDLSVLSQSGLGQRATSEYRIKAAASVALDALERGHRVQMVAVKEPLAFTGLGHGARHATRLLDTVAIWKAEGLVEFTATAFPSFARLPRGSTAVLCPSSINLNVALFREMLALGRLRKLRIVVMLSNDRTFVKLRAEQTELLANAIPWEELKDIIVSNGAAIYTLENGDELQDTLALQHVTAATGL